MNESVGIAARRGRVLVLATATSLGVIAAAACLPDLDAFPSGPDAGDGASPLATSLCGDGVIETLDDGGDAGESCDPGGDASVAGCESCQLRCSGALADTGHCYFLADDTSSLTGAIEACQGARAHVVTFAGAEEARFVGERFDAGYWVGLSRRSDLGGYGPQSGLNQPGWPTSGASCSGCFALGVNDAGAFAIEDDAGDPACLVAASEGWRAVPCDGPSARRTLCEREPIGERIYPCGGLLCTTLAVTAGEKRYVVGTTKVSAEEAAQFCTTYPGGSLVMFDGPGEREQLVRELVQRFIDEQNPTLEVWIGLAQQDGAWRWDDGDGGRAAPPWGAGQPGSGRGRAYLRIAATRLDTQLAQSDEDASAEARRVFVCQRPVPDAGP